MSSPVETGIQGATLYAPKVFSDGRGHFFEGYRASWLSGDRRFVQWNISRSAANVVRGLHFHRLQSDYWLVTDGLVRAALVDLRPNSPTRGKAVCVELDAANPRGLLIPPGVLHGYRILKDATVMYLVDHEYTGKDEYGVRWNDPALGLPPQWTDLAEPILSNRDTVAPLLKDAATVL
ncbi:MAG TPA: dTDP-4-dehydrorhamnose 3,5-epimerase [Tepidisphaeraceae bacterium]|nr:dTDP-4-dehydrorhamnose 3,5-epimerase [Tepidisphaeraceae bacterium]